MDGGALPELGTTGVGTGLERKRNLEKLGILLVHEDSPLHMFVLMTWMKCWQRLFHLKFQIILHQAFSIAALRTGWSGSVFVVGPILCTVWCLGAFLASTHMTRIASFKSCHPKKSPSIVECPPPPSRQGEGGEGAKLPHLKTTFLLYVKQEQKIKVKRDHFCSLRKMVSLNITEAGC